MAPAMTLDSWLTLNGLAEAEFGKRIGRKQASVNRYRRGKRIPDNRTMRKIFKATKGQVTANDFYGIEPEKKAA